MKYSKLNIFYLALTEKNALDFLWTVFRTVFARGSITSAAGVRENEPALKRKSPQTGIQD